ncbi:hypothetical protein D3C80_1963250 [compost metagenome]
MARRAGHFGMAALNADELIGNVIRRLISEYFFRHDLGNIIAPRLRRMISSAGLEHNLLHSPAHRPVYFPVQLDV